MSSLLQPIPARKIDPNTHPHLHNLAVKMNISEPGRHHGDYDDKNEQTDRNFFNSFLARVPRSAKGHTVAAIGEFVGTILFLFFAFAGTQVANISSNYNGGAAVDTKVVSQNPAQLLYISLSFGFSLAVNAWVFFRVSGGLFNPAVTFGMWIIGSLNWFRAILLAVMQILAGMAAAGLVKAIFPGELNVRTTLNENTSVGQGFVIEMILTAQLVFAIFMLATEKHAGTFIAPVGIGLALFIAELTGVFWTGGSLNPARSFGPAVVVHQFASYHWIYWIAPLTGSLIAAILYKLIKGLEYETANPDPEAGTHTGHTSEMLAAERSRSSHTFADRDGRPSTSANGAPMNHHASNGVPTRKEHV